jgi:hypothetical protein
MRFDANSVSALEEGTTTTIAATALRLHGLVQHVLSSPRSFCDQSDLDCLQALGIKRYTLCLLNTGHADDEISFIRHLSVVQRAKGQGCYGGSP